MSTEPQTETSRRRLVGSVETQDGAIVVERNGEILFLRQGADTITMNTAEAGSVLDDLSFLVTLAAGKEYA